MLLMIIIQVRVGGDNGKSTYKVNEIVLPSIHQAIINVMGPSWTHLDHLLCKLASYPN